MTVRRASIPLVLLGLLLGGFAPSAGAELPDGTVVITSRNSVDAFELPALVTLDSGSHSTLELAEAFELAPRDSTIEILAYTVNDGAPEAIDPTRFTPPGVRARYFDPALGDTLPATVLVAEVADTEARFDVAGNVATLSELLSAEGSALIFQTVPEPGLSSGLMIGLAGLLMGTRRRMHASSSATRRISGVGII